MVAAGYLYDVYVFGWSLFYILMVAQGFFGSAVYTVVGPYMAEIWPARLRASGMASAMASAIRRQVHRAAGAGADHGSGRCDQARRTQPGHARPGTGYFAVWYILGVIGFYVFGFEPKGRTFEEIDDRHGTPAQSGITQGRAAAE